MFSLFLGDSGWHTAFQEAKNLSLAPSETIITSSGTISSAYDSTPVGFVPMAYGKLQDFCDSEYSRGLSTRQTLIKQLNSSRRSGNSISYSRTYYSFSE